MFSALQRLIDHIVYYLYFYSIAAFALSVLLVFFVLFLLLSVNTFRIRHLIVVLYCLSMFYFIVGNRIIGLASGTITQNDVPQLIMTPFWSYAKFSQIEIRWQIYMNVFLFIPFGFMLPWCAEKLQRLWKVLLIAAAFSILIEAAQYFLRIGYCELDDVIHNTLGAMIGYGYWRLLCSIQTHIRGDRK